MLHNYIPVAAGSLLLGAAITYTYLRPVPTPSPPPQPQRKRRVAILGGSFNPITDAHLQMASEVIHSDAADEVWLVPCGPRKDKDTLRTSVLHRYFMCQLAVTARFSASFPVKVSAEELLLDKAYYTYWLLQALDEKYGDTCAISFVVGSDLLDSLPTWGGPKGWFLKQEFVIFPREGFAIPVEWTLRENVTVLGPVDDVPPNDVRLMVAHGSFDGEEEEEEDASRASGSYEEDVTRGGGRGGGGRRTPPQTTLMESNLSSTEVRRRIDASQGTLMSALGHPTFKAEGLVPNSVLRYIRKYELLGPFSKSAVTSRSRSRSRTSGESSDKLEENSNTTASTTATTATTATTTTTTAAASSTILTSPQHFSSSSRPTSPTTSPTTGRPTTSQEGTLRVGSQVVHLRVRSRTSKEDRKAVVALLGGTFDPITDGHLKMAAEVIHSGLADIVWIVPCGPRAGTSNQ
jgi:nicotinate (nicotinamide) nucleotide adenylyltransferase